MNESGKKYLRRVIGSVEGKVDVYSVIDTFGVHCPARQHALKKLLCSGIRGKGSVMQDLSEARDAVDRAIELEKSRGLLPCGAVSLSACPKQECECDYGS